MEDMPLPKRLTRRKAVQFFCGEPYCLTFLVSNATLEDGRRAFNVIFEDADGETNIHLVTEDQLRTGSKWADLQSRPETIPAIIAELLKTD